MNTVQSPRISVAMCTWNGEAYVAAQLESIAAQKLLPWEIVICDDASSDRTVAIVNEFSRSAPFRVRFIKNEINLGCRKNFEKCIDLCEGDLIATCDQDDVWYPQKLARLSQPFLADATVGGVFSDADLIDENGQLTGERLWTTQNFSCKKADRQVERRIARLLLKQHLVTGATMMFRSSLRSIFLPIESSWIHDGWITWMIVLYSRLVPVCEPLIQYRIHGRQEVGVVPATRSARLKRARQIGRKQYLKVARQYEAVRERWRANPGTNRYLSLEDFDGALALRYLRAELPDSKLLRAGRVLCGSPAYFKYARGLKSILKDILLKT